jgi:hypothetical protein
MALRMTSGLSAPDTIWISTLSMSPTSWSLQQPARGARVRDQALLERARRGTLGVTAAIMPLAAPCLHPAQQAVHAHRQAVRQAGPWRRSPDVPRPLHAPQLHVVLLAELCTKAALRPAVVHVHEGDVVAHTAAAEVLVRVVRVHLRSERQVREQASSATGAIHMAVTTVHSCAGRQAGRQALLAAGGLKGANAAEQRAAPGQRVQPVPGTKPLSSATGHAAGSSSSSSSSSSTLRPTCLSLGL